MTSVPFVEPSVPDQLAYALTTSLRIPSASRTVADFLFTNLLENHFHPAYTLPPTSFTNALTLSTTNNIDTRPNLMYPPAARHTPIPDHLLVRRPPQGPLKSFLHSAYVPIAVIPPYTMGYALMHDPQGNDVCFCANPFAPPVIARFVFDVSTSDMLLVVHGGRPKCIGLRALVNSPLNVREQYMVAVPALPYSASFLPSVPMWMISHIESREDVPQLELSDAEAPTTDLPQFDDFDNNLSVDPVPSHTTPLPFPASSQQPWPLSESGILADGTYPPPPQPASSPSTNSVEASTSAAAFSSNSVLQTLPALLQTLSGVFYAPSYRMDLPSPVPQYSDVYMSTFTGRAASRFILASKKIVHSMRQRFASLYYFAILSVSADGALNPLPPPPALKSAEYEEGSQSGLLDFCFTPSIESPSSGPPGSATNVSNTIDNQHQPPCTNTTLFNTSSSPPPLPLTQSEGQGQAARAIVPGPEEADGQARHCDKVDAEKAAAKKADGRKKKDAGFKDRERMLAARRLRNRLSAAKSNERKKAWVAALERDVLNSRQKLSYLSEKKLRVVEENKLLKAQVFLNRLLDV